MRQIISLLVFFLLVCASLRAQQTPIYSQYVLNEFIINPSAAGIDGMTSVNLTGRKQWIGWTHSPETYSASFSTRILKSGISVKKGNLKRGNSGRIGLGASLISDKNGAIQRTGIQLTYAYHLNIRHSQLSFGLTGLGYQFKIDEGLADLEGDGSDPIEHILGKSSFIPDVAFGVNYSFERYHIGASVFQLFQSPLKFGGENVDSKEIKHLRHYHVLGTYNHIVRGKPDWEVEPSFVLRMTEKGQFSADISTRVIYNREYWAGLSVRTSGDLILMFGLKISRAYVGYSFDYGFNQVTRLSYGSHEAFLAFKFGDSARRYRWWERY